MTAKFPWAIPARWRLVTFLSDYDKLFLEVEASGSETNSPYKLSLTQEGRDSYFVVVKVNSDGTTVQATLPCRAQAVGTMKREKAADELLVEAQRLLIKQGVLEGTPISDVYVQ